MKKEATHLRGLREGFEVEGDVLQSKTDRNRPRRDEALLRSEGLSEATRLLQQHPEGA